MEKNPTILRDNQVSFTISFLPFSYAELSGKCNNVAPNQISNFLVRTVALNSCGVRYAENMYSKILIPGPTFYCIYYMFYIT